MLEVGCRSPIAVHHHGELLFGLAEVEDCFHGVDRRYEAIRDLMGLGQPCQKPQLLSFGRKCGVERRFRRQEVFRKPPSPRVVASLCGGGETVALSEHVRGQLKDPTSEADGASLLPVCLLYTSPSPR